MALNKARVLMLAGLIEGGTRKFDMRYHPDCLIGNAYYLAVGEDYGDRNPWNSASLCEWLGLEPTYDNRYALYMAEGCDKDMADITRGDAVCMLRNLEATGVIQWP